MNAIILSIQGNLKPVALRHHVFKLGNLLDICGFLNYRQGMSELYIHAEGEEEMLAEFTNQVNQLTAKHDLKCFTETAAFEDCRNFIILPLWKDADNNLIHINENLNAVLAKSNSIEDLGPPIRPIIAQSKNRNRGLKRMFASLKQVSFW